MRGLEGQSRPRISMTNAEAIVRAIVQKARAGSVAAAEWLADRSEGKALNGIKMEVSTPMMVGVSDADLANRLLLAGAQGADGQPTRGRANIAGDK